MSGWATAQDVKDLTGMAVSEATLAQAQAVIELFSGTTIDATDNDLIGSRNRRLLKQAVCWQAPFIDAHPDYATAMDMQALSQDGVSATPAHANAALLAPLAKRCLDRLSWARAPLRVRRRGQSRPEARYPTDSAAADDNRPWTPL